MGTEQNGNLQFVCGLCETRLNVKSLFAGRKINCPKCHKKVVVPKQSDGIATAPDAASIPKKTPPLGDSPTRQRRPDGHRGELDRLRAENKTLRERLSKQTDSTLASAGNSVEALARARKRIAELENELSQVRLADRKKAAQAGVPVRDGKE